MSDDDRDALLTLLVEVMHHIVHGRPFAAAEMLVRAQAMVRKPGTLSTGELAEARRAAAMGGGGR